MTKNFHVIGQQSGVPIYGPEAFLGMRVVGKYAARCLSLLEEVVVPGITTEAIDQFVFDYAMQNNLVPAPLNYRGFPKSCCTSVNHVVCHGIPGPKILREGDIVNVDVTFIRDGWHGDSNKMYFVGPIAEKARRLCAITLEALNRAIAIVRPGATLGDIGHAIQSFAESHGYSVVRDFCGHGVGYQFHAAPEVLHYGKPHKGLTLCEGMFFTIEPMINIGRADVKVLGDGWTAVTRDKSLSAQYEHTLGVTRDGCDIFTQPEAL